MTKCSINHGNLQQAIFSVRGPGRSVEKRHKERGEEGKVMKIQGIIKKHGAAGKAAPCD
jgi:hypothetical protein